MENYIRTYQKKFSDDECSGMVNWFEVQDEHNYTEHTVLQGHRKFDEINLNKHREETMQTQLDIYDRFGRILETYKQDVKLHPKAWPEESKWEEIRLKRYKANSGNFLNHVDVGNHDSARRFLVVFLYLNTVEKGGETEFPTFDLKVSAERGKVLVFPSTWTYLHRGNTPISNDKYILGSYLHYV